MQKKKTEESGFELRSNVAKQNYLQFLRMNMYHLLDLSKTHYTHKKKNKEILIIKPSIKLYYVTNKKKLLQ